MTHSTPSLRADSDRSETALELLQELGERQRELLSLYRRQQGGTGPITTILRDIDVAQLQRGTGSQREPALTEAALQALTPDELDRLATLERAQATAHEQMARLCEEIATRMRQPDSPPP